MQVPADALEPALVDAGVAFQRSEHVGRVDHVKTVLRGHIWQEEREIRDRRFDHIRAEVSVDQRMSDWLCGHAHQSLLDVLVVVVEHEKYRAHGAVLREEPANPFLELLPTHVLALPEAVVLRQTANPRQKSQYSDAGHLHRGTGTRSG